MFAPFKSTTLHILSVLSISISISFTCERTFFLLALMFTTCSEGGRARSKLAFFEQNAFKVQTDEFQKEFTDGLWNDSSRGSGKVNRDDDNSHGLRATFASRQAAHTYVCFRYQYVHLIYISRRAWITNGLIVWPTRQNLKKIKLFAIFDWTNDVFESARKRRTLRFSLAQCARVPNCTENCEISLRILLFRFS